MKKLSNCLSTKNKAEIINFKEIFISPEDKFLKLFEKMQKEIIMAVGIPKRIF